MPDSVIPAEWMAKAQADLRSARVLRSASPPLLEQAVYLAAQAAEKSLKALLIKHGVPYRLPKVKEHRLKGHSILSRTYE